MEKFLKSKLQVCARHHRAPNTLSKHYVTMDTRTLSSWYETGNERKILFGTPQGKPLLGKRQKVYLQMHILLFVCL
jgi:hypothetical protein